MGLLNLTGGAAEPKGWRSRTTSASSIKQRQEWAQLSMHEIMVTPVHERLAEQAQCSSGTALSPSRSQPRLNQENRAGPDHQGHGELRAQAALR